MATVRCEQLDLFKEAKLNHNVYLIMMHYFRVVNDDQAEKMAGDLIVNADLQVLIRARCYLVLAVVTKNAACEASCTLKGLSRCFGNQLMVDIEYQACQRCRIPTYSYISPPESWDESWLDEARRVHKLVHEEAIADGDVIL
ncbi:hypothetical protein LTR10_009012 [Elasticomyces elasticus]|nr:hypothetical protein LTR10_009012 [Elasticomyces elasticus]